MRNTMIFMAMGVSAIVRIYEILRISLEFGSSYEVKLRYKQVRCNRWRSLWAK